MRLAYTSSQVVVASVSTIFPERGRFSEHVVVAFAS